MPSRMLHLPSPSLPLPLLISASFAISVVSSEGAAVDCSGALSCWWGAAAQSLNRGRSMGWDQKKNTEGGSAPESLPVSVFSRKVCGVQSEGKMGFGSRVGGRQVGRATLSEVMLADE